MCSPLTLLSVKLPTYPQMYRLEGSYFYIVIKLLMFVYRSPNRRPPEEVERGGSNSSAREVKGLHIDMEVGSVQGKDSGRAQRARDRRARMGLLTMYQSRSPLEREMEFLFTMSLLS